MGLEVFFFFFFLEVFLFQVVGDFICAFATDIPFISLVFFFILFFLSNIHFVYGELAKQFAFLRRHPCERKEFQTVYYVTSKGSFPRHSSHDFAQLEALGGIYWDSICEAFQFNHVP